MYGAIGALMAVQQRGQNGGKGQIVDVALTEAVFSLMESMLPEFGMNGFVRERTGASLPGIVPSNTYTTRDGAVCCHRRQRRQHFQALHERHRARRSG